MNKTEGIIVHINYLLLFLKNLNDSSCFINIVTICHNYTALYTEHLQPLPHLINN